MSKSVKVDLIDSHCHLDFSCFDQDRADILRSCQQANISTIVLPGTQASGWAGQIALASQYAQIKFALGLHPYFLAQYSAEHLTLLAALLDDYKSQVVALGEIGLDGAIDVNWQLQEDVFIKQLNLAQDLALPVILHHRRSHNQLLRLIKQQKFSQGGIVHAFSGSKEQAMSYLELGFKIGVGGGITYPRANKTRTTVANLPLSSLVLETDAPDMPLYGKQGQRNSPENLPIILAALCELRAEPKAQIQTALLKNVQGCLKNI
ncbi:TatD family hydrolase [Paraglaciecola aestuariivivens]